MKKTLPKHARMLRRWQFKKIMSIGTRLPGSHVVIYFHSQRADRPIQGPVLGMTVSKKHGKAHERNRFKRVVREAFRSCRHQLPSHLALNIMPLTKTLNGICPNMIIDDLLLLKNCVWRSC